jgi:sporulation protein YlmC with PRC-barrel domain
LEHEKRRWKMLRSLDSMLGSAVVATDGEVGKAYNVLFDDRSWTIRYLVVEISSWFTRGKVLISPSVLGTPNWAEKKIPVLLTREQSQKSPSVDSDQPVSRQQERAMMKHYNWLANPEPFILPDVLSDVSVPECGAFSESEGDPHLRSAKEICRYQVKTSDGTLGDITDFVIDDEMWEIHKLVVSADSSPDNHKVLVPTRLVSNVSWEQRYVQLSFGANVTMDFLPKP